MAETFGSLIDKITISELKIYHTQEQEYRKDTENPWLDRSGPVRCGHADGERLGAEDRLAGGAFRHGSRRPGRRRRGR